MNNKTGMTKAEELKYAVYFLEHNKNRIKSNEIEYYKGLTGLNPHNIPDAVWQEATKELEQREQG